MDRRPPHRVREKNTLEGRVRAAYKELQRNRMNTGYYNGFPETVHMTLAKRFGIPCQQVLDITDPERERQGRRIARYGARVSRKAKFDSLKAAVEPLMVEWTSPGLTPERREEIGTDPQFMELWDFLMPGTKPLDRFRNV